METLAVFAVTALGSLSAAGAPTPNITPTNVEVQVLYEGFEGPFPGTLWSVSDQKPANGADFWAGSTYKTYAGNASVWSAGIGQQTLTKTFLEDDFEGGNFLSNWVAEADINSINGDDHWGPATNAANSGTTSIWCAAIGTNTAGTPNVQTGQYDNYQDAMFWRPVNLSGFPHYSFSYYYKLDAEVNYDYFYAMYYAGGTWSTLAVYNTRGTPWTQVTFDLPASATRIGFRWLTDSSVVYTGAWVDDVKVIGDRTDTNVALHTYDNNATAIMGRSVDLSPYVSGRLEYRYWTDTEQGKDYLAAGYYSDDWHFTDVHSGTTGGWRQATLSIPVNATLIGFLFSSDGQGNGEGAYLDEIRVFGAVLPITCSAEVDIISGVEWSTVFRYSTFLSGGLPPYSVVWDFADGTNSSSPAPSHIYRDIGNFTATFEARDKLGQTCSATAPTVSVLNDISTVSITPSITTMIAGRTNLFLATDARGRPLEFTWSVTPSTCGAFDATSGSVVNFTADIDSGGLTCELGAAYSTASTTAKIYVDHDISVITVSPPSGTVVEAKSISLSAVDAYGHGLEFRWLTTCGRVAPSVGPSTTFTALTDGGVVCVVSATYEGASARSEITVVHDTSAITLSPETVTMTEGTGQSFAAVDKYGHPFDSAWQVEPASCGAMEPSSGISSTFKASVDAGGMTCTIRASYGSNSRTATATVTHDDSAVTIDPLSATVEEGGSVLLSVHDRYGHPYAATWSLTPPACGELSDAVGTASMFKSSLQAGGAACTVQASAAGQRLLASILVNFGAPVSIAITPAAAEVQQGRTWLFAADVMGSNDHLQSGVAVDWSSTCGALSAPVGISTAVTVSGAPGTSCAVTAAHGGLTATASVKVLPATPFTITITSSSASVGPGGSALLTASVKDAYGNPVNGANMTWSTNCGTVSPSRGPTTTYTPPTTLGASSCSVTASVASGTATGEKLTTLEGAGSGSLLVLGVAAAAAIVVGAVFMRRKRGRGGELAPPPMQ